MGGSYSEADGRLCKNDERVNICSKLIISALR